MCSISIFDFSNYGFDFLNIGLELAAEFVSTPPPPHTQPVTAFGLNLELKNCWFSVVIEFVIHNVELK